MLATWLKVRFITYLRLTNFHECESFILDMPHGWVFQKLL